MINKKKLFIAGIITIIFLIAIMIFTTPTQAEFDKWIVRENSIVCETIDWSEECTKDNRIIWSSSSHSRNVGIFASYEKNYEFGNGETLNVKTLGFFDNFFKMKEGKIWEILN